LYFDQKEADEEQYVVLDEVKGLESVVTIVGTQFWCFIYPIEIFSLLF